MTHLMPGNTAASGVNVPQELGPGYPWCSPNRRGDGLMGFFSWHREQVVSWQRLLKLDSYQLLWIAFFKGLVLGALAVWLLG